MICRRPSLIVILTLVVSAIAAVLAVCNPVVAPDTVCRYAPMAEAFAHGNWTDSFHPRFGVGFPVIAGCLVFITHLDGLLACSAVSTFAWAMGMLPLFGIAKKVFDERTAWFAAILYIICPQMLLWGLKGLREPFKALGVLLALEAVFKAGEGKWSNVVRAAIGMALMAWFKADSVVLVPCFLIAFAVADRFGRKTAALALASVLILLPACWLVYDWTGVFLPALQYVHIWNKLV